MQVHISVFTCKDRRAIEIYQQLASASHAKYESRTSTHHTTALNFSNSLNADYICTTLYISLHLAPAHPLPTAVVVIAVMEAAMPKGSSDCVCSQVFACLLIGSYIPHGTNRQNPPSLPREDVLAVWKELERARDTLASIQALGMELRGELGETSMLKTSTTSTLQEEHLSSVPWLKVGILLMD